MAIKFENMTLDQIGIALNSGKYIYLGPHEISAEIPDNEVERNRKIDRYIVERKLRKIEIGDDVQSTQASAKASSQEMTKDKIPGPGKKGK